MEIHSEFKRRFASHPPADKGNGHVQVVRSNLRPRHPSARELFVLCNALLHPPIFFLLLPQQFISAFSRISFPLVSTQSQLFISADLIMTQQITSLPYTLTDGHDVLVFCLACLYTTGGLRFTQLQHTRGLWIASEVVIGGEGPRLELRLDQIRHRITQLFEVCHHNFNILVGGPDSPDSRPPPSSMRETEYFRVVTRRLSRMWRRRLSPSMVQHLVRQIATARFFYLRSTMGQYPYADNAIACDANIMLLNIITHEDAHDWPFSLADIGWNQQRALGFLLDTWMTRIRLSPTAPLPVLSIRVVSRLRLEVLRRLRMRRQGRGQSYFVAAGGPQAASGVHSASAANAPELFDPAQYFPPRQ